MAVAYATSDSSAAPTKVYIAESMLHTVCSWDLDDLRINGESCVSKIRLVGAIVLGIIDNKYEPTASGNSTEISRFIGRDSVVDMEKVATFNQ